MTDPDKRWLLKYAAEKAARYYRHVAVSACEAAGLSAEALEAGVVKELVEALQKIADWQLPADEWEKKWGSYRTFDGSVTDPPEIASEALAKASVARVE